MTNRLRMLVPVLVFVTGVAAWTMGCKQEEGDRCQITADCADGLMCSESTQRCTRGTDTPFDANLPEVEINAGVDAMPDATPDAMPDPA